MHIWPVCNTKIFICTQQDATLWNCLSLEDMGTELGLVSLGSGSGSWKDSQEVKMTMFTLPQCRSSQFPVCMFSLLWEPSVLEERSMSFWDKNMCRTWRTWRAKDSSYLYMLPNLKSKSLLKAELLHSKAKLLPGMRITVNMISAAVKLKKIQHSL